MQVESEVYPREGSIPNNGGRQAPVESLYLLPHHNIVDSTADTGVAEFTTLQG